MHFLKKFNQFSPPSNSENNNYDIYNQLAYIEGLSRDDVDVFVESGVLEEDYFSQNGLIRISKGNFHT